MKNWISEKARNLNTRLGYAQDGLCLILVGTEEGYAGYVQPIQQAG